jgi:ferrous iron transport protein B
MCREAEKITRHNSNTTPDAIIADWRYGFINGLLKQGVISGGDELRRNFSDNIDRVVTHKVLGPLLMLGVLWLMFYVTFTLGAYPRAGSRMDSTTWPSSAPRTSPRATSSP